MNPQRQLLQNYCPVCGSAMAYSPGSKAISCPACQFKRPLSAKASGHVQERSLQDGVRFDGWELGLGISLEGRKCGNCQALLAAEMGAFPPVCPVCGAEDLQPDDSFETNLQPWGVLPFAISRSGAASHLQSYLRTSPMRPMKLSEAAKPDQLTPVFVPLWSVDAFLKASWTAKSGFVYGEDEKKEAVQWEPSAGYLEQFFENLTQMPLTGLDQPYFGEKLTYDLDAVLPYHPDMLEGNFVLGYTLKPKKSLKKIEKLVDTRLKGLLVDRIPGKKYDDLVIKTERSTLAFRNLLAPIWVAHYRYAGRHFTFVVNGQNGKCLGPKPLSMIKVGGLSLLAALLIVILVLSLH